MNKPSKHGEETRQRIMDYLLANQVVICPVSYEEIAEGVGLKSVSGIAFHLKTLEEQGKIKRPAKQYRHIEIVNSVIPLTKKSHHAKP